MIAQSISLVSDITSLGITPQGISWALAYADKKWSKLPQKVASELAMSTPKLRILLNNLCALKEGVNYVEVGTYFGGTLACAMYGNRGMFTGIDNFSEFDDLDAVTIPECQGKNPAQVKRDTIERIIQEYGPEGGKFYEISGENFDLQLIPPIDIFLCDGKHDYENTYAVFKHFSPKLASPVIFIADDYMLPGVSSSIEQVFYEDQWIILDEHRRFSGKLADLDEWCNGMYLVLMKRAA